MTEQQPSVPPPDGRTPDTTTVRRSWDGNGWTMPLRVVDPAQAPQSVTARPGLGTSAR